MKKVFISQPMRGKTDDEILSERTKAIACVKEYVHEMYNDDIEIIDTFFKDFNGNRLQFLGKSISEGLALCDIAVFIGEWDEFDGCLCENFIAGIYGVDILYSNVGDL